MQKHLHREIFINSCNDASHSQLSSGEVVTAMLPKFVKLLWGPFSIVIYSSHVVQEFQFGRTAFEDGGHCSLPVTVATEQNVAKVKCLIKEDP